MTGQRQPTFATWLPTRRRVLVGAGCAFAGFAANPHHVCSSPGDDVSRTAESIHQEPVFKASRKVLYEALTQAAQFDKVTKLSAAMQTGTPPGMAPTEISREVGGSFLLFGGHILGRQVELVPNERIVQAWRVANWAPGIYSIVKFELLEAGSGTKLVFDHTGFPNGRGEELAAGWKANYWQPLEKFLT